MGASNAQTAFRNALAATAGVSESAVSILAIVDGGASTGRHLLAPSSCVVSITVTVASSALASVTGAITAASSSTFITTLNMQLAALGIAITSVSFTVNGAPSPSSDGKLALSEATIAIIAGSVGGSGMLIWCIIWLRRRKRSTQNERRPAAAMPRQQEHIQMQSRSSGLHAIYSQSESAPAPPPQATFSTSAREDGVYSGWFRIASGSQVKLGSARKLTPLEARDFLLRSGLSASTLSNVWRAVDARDGLDYRQFVMACRLVALVQNGTAASMSQDEGHASLLAPLQVFPQMQGVEAG
jgi:hypothetical protein